MNKRFIIYVVTMSVVLYFVNQYYTSKKKEEYEAYQAAQKKEAFQKEHANEKDVLTRTAKIENLPLVRIYSAFESQEQPLTWAVKVNQNTYMTLAWEQEWERTLTIEGSIAHLVKTDDLFALYSTSNEPQVISTFLPQIGDHDMQIITFTAGKPSVMLGEYEEGQLFFPTSSPSDNGIVLYLFEGKYVPVGVYYAKKSTFLPLTSLSNFNPYITYLMETHAGSVTDKQEYYVLENETMQIVFTNWGGAIAEINLPFQGKKNASSIVLPINFDRLIEKKYTANSYFPAHPYHVANDTTLKQPGRGGYYPLLRRGIEKNSGYPPYSIPPEYYAFNTLSEDPETASAYYKVTQFTDQLIEFEATFPHRKIIKTYHFPKEGNAAPYCLNAMIKIEGDSRGLWISSGVPEVELISGSPAPTIKYSIGRNSKRVIEKVSLPKTTTMMTSFQPDWISNSNGYFTLIIDPLDEVGMGFQITNIPGTTDPSRIVLIDSEYQLYPSNKYPGYEVQIPLKRSTQPMNFRLYAGPIDKNILSKVDNTYTSPVTGSNPGYTETQSFHGWFAFISEPFAKFLYFIMNFFHTFTGSWGISIILLTVVLRILMYPLNAWSIRSTLKMQEIAPKMEKIKEKYKKDPKQMQMEMMSFYKQHKVNPFGGCLPLVIQMPFLFGMFDLLKSAFPLRGSSFIPGWINDLTAPDVIFSWGYPIPFIGNSLHLLPLLLGVVMFFQQKLAAKQSKNSGLLTEQQKQQQKMGMIMTIVFTFLFYKFPSGLNIYWLSSMVLQIVQQLYMTKGKKMIGSKLKEVVIKQKKK